MGINWKSGNAYIFLSFPCSVFKLSYRLLRADVHPHLVLFLQKTCSIYSPAKRGRFVWVEDEDDDDDYDEDEERERERERSKKRRWKICRLENEEEDDDDDDDDDEEDDGYFGCKDKNWQKNVHTCGDAC